MSGREAINLPVEWCQFKVAINTPLFGLYAQFPPPSAETIDIIAAGCLI